MAVKINIHMSVRCSKILHCIHISIDQELSSEWHTSHGKDVYKRQIEMGAMDGVTMARKLRQDNQTVQIIFITGYADYISDGYEVDALHYLMKPIQEEKFFTVLDRAVTKLIKNEKFLNIISQGEMIRLPICQINYAEVNSNYITIHSQQTITLKMTLSELEKKLDSHFFRAGRSALVNLKKISRVTKKEIYLQDGSIIPLPRGAYEKVNRAIINMD